MDAIPARFLHNVVHPMPWTIPTINIFMAGISTSHGSCLRHWVAHLVDSHASVVSLPNPDVESSAESAMNHIMVQSLEIYMSSNRLPDFGNDMEWYIYTYNIYITYIYIYIYIWIFDLKISQDFQRWYFFKCIFRREEFQDCAHLCPPLHRAKASLPKPPKARKARTRQQLPICVIVPRVGWG